MSKAMKRVPSESEEVKHSLKLERERRKRMGRFASILEQKIGERADLIYADPQRSRNNIHLVNGIITRRPKTENRTSFVLAYQSDIPCYDGKSGAPLGNSICYALIRTEHVDGIDYSVQFKDRVVIFTEDDNAMNGGTFCMKEDLEKIARYFPGPDIDAQLGNFSRASDLE